MNYRKAVLLDAEDASTAAVKTLDLKGLDPISRLYIQLKALNNGSTPTAHPAKAITKIELIDGSDVLYSLSGIEQQALNFYQTGHPTPDLLNYVDNEYCAAMMQLNFGRWLWDEDFAFDPAKFKNPQLKVTHNKALGGSVPDAATLSVVCDMFDDRKINPMAYLMAKEHYSYTLVASAKETVELPTDYPLRMLIVQSLAAGKQPHEQYNKIKLSENNGKKIPLEDSISNLIKYILGEYDSFEERVRAMATTSAVTHYVAPTFNVGHWGSERDADTGYLYFGLSYGGTVDLKGSAAGQANFNSRGMCPHGALPIIFGDLWEAAMWYDVTKLAKLEAIITAGSGCTTSSTAQIITEQLKRY